jgi:hypothetical protein
LIAQKEIENSNIKRGELILINQLNGNINQIENKNINLIEKLTFLEIS